ncbi:MAG: AAA family ATPase [Cytophagales bacterium]|nr:AAA family ATPase [Cytophagales bacterium]
MDIISGVVERITYHNAENGWTVLKLKAKGQKNLIPVVAYQSKVFAGATVELQGEWGSHPKYGEQFKAQVVQELKPASASALEKYLGSGLIYGVGPKTAKRIVQYFGDQTLDVFDDEMDRLMEVPGIAQTKLRQIRSSWEEHRSIRNVMLFLQEYGVSTLFAVKIFKQYEHEAIDLVKENPYRLSKDIYGIGFFSADKIALAMGFAADSPQRVQAAVKHCLDSSRDQGHCYLTRMQISEGLKGLIALNDEQLISEQLRLLEQENELAYRDIDDEGENVRCYYAKSLYFDELNTANAVRKLNRRLATDMDRIKRWLNRYNEAQPFPLSSEQYECTASICGFQFSILTGGPGCGKTTATKAIVSLAKAMGKNVLLAAPTGRAAQRMSEVIGLEAKTIHRLLVFDPSNGGFKKGKEDPLETDFLIVDECSMLDISLTASLLDAVPPNAQVLFIGDVDQLPSVGAGNVLKDLIESQTVPCFRLTQIFRQGRESKIITYAHQINQGILPTPPSPVHQPSLWQGGSDCLFIDSEEANQEQARFIRKVREVMKNTLDDSESETIVQEEKGVYKSLNKKENDYFAEHISEEELGQLKQNGGRAYVFNIPEKFLRADIPSLLQTRTEAEALGLVLDKVHPWSSLNYGFTANDMLLRLYGKTIPQKVGSGEIQILTPMTRGSLGTHNINQLIQETYNPHKEGKAFVQLGDRLFRVGDRVIQRKNNYDLEVFNGDIGNICSIDHENDEIAVQFGKEPNSRIVAYRKESLIELELAYAITIHKSQGSEFDYVIIPVATQHFKMLYRNLIYTGLTRAKKMAVFVGSRKALALCVRNVDNRKRQTYLKALLKK